MNKWLWVVIVLYTSWLDAGTKNFGLIHRFALQKDQIAEVIIKKDYPKTYAKEGVLQFRWTLFQNRRLVLLVDYEGFKSQYILEPKFGRRSIRIYLTGDYKRIDHRPFVLLTFERFDRSKKRAHMLAEFSDPAKRLEIKITQPKKQR